MTASVNAGGLTDQELRVLKAIASGRCTKEIAGEMALSAKTVEYHRASLMRKLQIFDVASLTRFAMKTNLIPVTEHPTSNIQHRTSNSQPVKPIRTTTDLAQALLAAASEAAAGTADVLQINALCQTSDALIRLARLQMEARAEGRQGPNWVE